MTRGIRLNNPGNIEKGQDWKGLSEDQPDSRFCKFISPEYGIRAICKILLSYQKRYGLNTVEKIISRWAPEFENPTGAYIENVAKAIRKPADEPLDIQARDVLAGLVRGIVKQENGLQPYSNDEIYRGVDMALR